MIVKMTSRAFSLVSLLSSFSSSLFFGSLLRAGVVAPWRIGSRSSYVTFSSRRASMASLASSLSFFVLLSSFPFLLPSAYPSPCFIFTVFPAPAMRCSPAVNIQIFNTQHDVRHSMSGTPNPLQPQTPQQPMKSFHWRRNPSRAGS
jgi:hypothetical protein